MLERHIDLCLLIHTALVGIHINLKLPIFLDRKLQSFSLLLEDRIQSLELLVAVSLFFNGDLGFLLHNIVPLLQLNGYFGIFLRLFFLGLKFLGHLFQKVPGVLLFLFELVDNLVIKLLLACDR